MNRASCIFVLSLSLSAVLGCSGNSSSSSTTATTVKSITVSPASSTILVGKQQQLSATGTYSNGSTTTSPSGLTWSSSDTSVATVDSAGLVKGVAPGSVTISATVGAVSGSSSAKVQTILATLDRSADVAGPDQDHNGVRDDIDQVIAGFALSASQKKALTQFAAALQTAILNSADSNSAYLNAVELHRGQECVLSQLNADARTYTGQIKAFTLDTQQRSNAFISFSHNIGGSVFPQPTGTLCK